MIKPSHTKVVFFFVLLISFSIRHLNAQVLPQDTLKKAKTDSLPAEQFSDELESQVIYSAEDSIVSLPATGKVYLYGKARVVYGGVEMEAEVIEIDYQTNVMSAYGRRDSIGKMLGSPIFREGSQPPMEAEKIMFNLKTGKGKIFNAMTRQGELLVIGNEIKKDSNNVVYMRNMRCIPCEEADARTVFVASRAKVIPDDKIVTGPMYLEIGGVPTPLGLPFGYFPNTKKQHNGILLPTFGTSRQFGYNLQGAGFYWGISDQTDMVIRTDLYANGSFGVNTTNNYKVLYKATGSTFLSYNRYNLGDRDVQSSYSQRSAFAVRWRHTQDTKLNPSITFNADVNYQSNQNLNRLNAVSNDQFLQSQFISNIAFSKSFKNNSLLSLTARQEQNTQTRRISVVLPAITYYVNSFNPFKNKAHVRQTAIDKIRMSYRLESSNVLSGTDSTLFKGDWSKELRYGLSQSVPISTNFNIFKYITATPQLDLSSMVSPTSIRKSFVYENIGSKDGARDSIIGVVKTNTLQAFAVGYDARFSTSFNTKVYFDYVFRKGKVRQIRHLMIPSLNYAYRPDLGAEQFGFWKQVQQDSLGRKGYYSIFENSVYAGPARGRTNSLGISISNNVEAKVRRQTDTGSTFVKTKILQDLSIGTNYNFAADSMKMQIITASARTTLFKYFYLLAGSTFDPYAWDHALQRRVSAFSYTKGQGLARWVNGNLAINTGISSSMIEEFRQRKLKDDPAKKKTTELSAPSKLAWNFSLAYRLDLTNINDRRLQPAHTLQLSGSLMPTKYWRLDVSTGFNFESRVFSRTQFTVTRDLKCWAARIEWVPFGVGKRYDVGISLKTSLLSDFKLRRQNAWYDAVR